MVAKTAKAIGFALIAVFGAGAGVVACGGSIPSMTNECMCAAGTVCCASGGCAPTQAACDGNTPSLPTQVWVGTFEGFVFPSGAEGFTFAIYGAPDGATSATVVLGEGPPPPPPTDPDVPWPSDDIFSVKNGIEGFPYVAHDLRGDAVHLTFWIERWSPWQAWCELQTPYPSPNLGYACVPAILAVDEMGGYLHDAAGNCLAATNPPTPVACAKGFPLCYSTPPICKCEASGCRAWEMPPISFDLTLSDDVGSGSVNNIVITRDGLTSFRLTRMPL